MFWLLICFLPPFQKFQLMSQGYQLLIPVLYLNHDFTEVIQQLWRTAAAFSSFIRTPYFKHWHTPLYKHVFIVKMLAWCACISIYES